MQEEQYWVQVNGGSPYVTNDSAHLWAMLYGLLIGVGEDESVAHRWATVFVDQVVKDREGHTEKLRDGRTLRLSIYRPGEGDE